MSGLYPSTPNPLYQWQWLLSHPFHTNVSLDTCLQVSLTKRSSEDDGWFGKSFKWWATRTAYSTQHDLEDVDDRWGRPPRSWCPFPIADLTDPNAGRLAFVTGRGHRHWHPDTVPDEVNEAVILKEINECAEFRPVQFRFVLPSDAPFRGTSYVLASLVALLSKELNLDIPPEVAATGGWDLNRRCLVPVSVETLQCKLNLLHCWGYRTVLVVAGQPLAELNTHRMLLRSIPQELPQAVRIIITELWGSRGHEQYAKYCDNLRQSEACRWWVERNSTRNAFEHWLEQREAPRVFWLHGVAGIGKSHMLAKFREALSAEGRFPCHYSGITHEPLDAFLERARHFISEWYRLPQLDSHHTSQSQLFLEASRAASSVLNVSPPPTIVVDGLECLHPHEVHAFVELLVQLQEAPLRIVVSSEGLPPPQLRVCQHQLSAMTIREIYDMLLASVGRPRLVQLASRRFPDAGGESAAIDELLHLLHRITRGLPIFLDLMCGALCDEQRDWIPNINTTFERYASTIVANRLTTLEDRTMSLEVLSILLVAGGAIPQDAIVGAIRKARPGKRNIEKLTLDVLARLRFAVYSWRHDGEMTFRISHPLFTRAMKHVVEDDNLADAKRDLATWCAAVGIDHSHPYALQHGPRHILEAMDNPHQVSGFRDALYRLARDQILLQSLRVDPTIDAATVTGFIRAAFEAARAEGCVGKGAEFALQIAQVNGAILEHFDILHRAARNTLGEIETDIQNSLSGAQQRALASLVVSVQWLHVWRLGADRQLLNLLRRFFRATDNTLLLSHKFRDAAIPLMAAVLCGCAFDLGDKELGNVGRMFLSALDRRRSVACGQAVIYQSERIINSDVRGRLRRSAAGLVTSRWERDAVGKRLAIDRTFVSLEVAVQRIVKTLLKVGDTAEAIAVLRSHPQLDRARYKWIAVDIIEGGDFGKHPELASQLFESVFRSWRDETSQGLVARAAVKVADRDALPHWDLESELLRINALCLASPWMDADHKATTLARLAVQSASGCCRTLAQNQIDEAFRMAGEIGEPSERLQACLLVASHTRQIVDKRPLHFSNVAVKQLVEIERALLKCAEPAAKKDMATCGVEIDPAPAPEIGPMRDSNKAALVDAVEATVAEKVMPLEVILKAQADLAKAWAHCGDLSRANSVVFNRELSAFMNTASPLRGDALAEIAMKALDYGAGFDRLVQRSPEHRLTVVSRVLGRLCQRGEYARAAALVSDEMQHSLAWDGAKAWAADLVKQAGELVRSLNRNQAHHLLTCSGVGNAPGERMWGYLDTALLASCGGRPGGRDIANAALDMAWNELNGRLEGVDLAVFGHELCAHKREHNGRKALESAIAMVVEMKTAAVALDRFKLEGELLERCALCGDAHHVEAVQNLVWSHAYTPSLRDNVRQLSSVAFRFARSAIIDRARLDPVGIFISELRRLMRLRLDNAGPDMMLAASAVLRAARGECDVAESMASQIRNEKIRTDALCEIAKAYLLADQIEDVRRIAFGDLHGKQIKALVRLILSPCCGNRDRLKPLLALLEPASRFLDSAAWCAAGLIMVDQSITDEQVERIIVTSTGGRDPEARMGGLDQEGQS